MYELIEGLSDSFRCIALDRFGYGYSDIIVSDRQIDDIVDEYIEFLKALKIPTEDVIFVGHSISTFYGLSLSSKVNLKGLVLIENENIGTFSGYLTKLSCSTYYHLKNTPIKKLFNKSAIKTLIENRNLPVEVKDATIKILEERLPNENMYDELKSFLKEVGHFNEKYISDKYPKTLLVCRNATYENNVKLKEYIKDATILNFGKTDHFIHYKYFDEIINNIKKLYK